MQLPYAERFEREMGCTEVEWLGWLPQVAEPRVIGLVRIPRLLVSFRFAGVDEAARQAFMQRFDLYMHRGGG